MARSARNGLMNETITTNPASTNNRATSVARRIFSTRSAAENPRSLFRPWANVVAVQHIGVPPGLKEPLLEQARDGGFTCPGKSGEPDTDGCLALLPGAEFLIDVHRLPGFQGITTANIRKRTLRLCTETMRETCLCGAFFSPQFGLKVDLLLTHNQRLRKSRLGHFLLTCHDHLCLKPWVCRSGAPVSGSWR